MKRTIFWFALVVLILSLALFVEANDRPCDQWTKNFISAKLVDVEIVVPSEASRRPYYHFVLNLESTYYIPGVGAQNEPSREFIRYLGSHLVFVEHTNVFVVVQPTAALNAPPSVVAVVLSCSNEDGHISTRPQSVTIFVPSREAKQKWNDLLYSALKKWSDKTRFDIVPRIIDK